MTRYCVLSVIPLQWLGVRKYFFLLALVLCGCSPKQETTEDNGSLTGDALQVSASESLMLSGDWVPDDPHQIDFDNLPVVPSEHAIVSDVRDADGKRVNQHNYLVYFDGLFWAMWSDGIGVPRVGPGQHRNRVPGHDREDQHVSFATSKDGLKWSAIQDLAGAPEKGYGWIARGFWIRDGKLLALASRYKAPSYAGEGLQLHAFELEKKGDRPKWKHLGMANDNAMNNFPPKKIPSGEWMMSRRDSLTNVYFMVGGTEAFDKWESFPIEVDEGSGLAPEEPGWWVLPDNRLVALFRDNGGSGFLFRSYSSDNGRSWSKPVKTNFPDAKSKFSTLRLADGRYVLVSNPSPKKRDPLAISVSDDGITFHTMGYLVGGRHIDYPHVIQHEENLLVAFAGAKQSVEVLKIKLSDLDKIKMTALEKKP